MNKLRLILFAFIFVGVLIGIFLSHFATIDTVIDNEIAEIEIDSLESDNNKEELVVQSELVTLKCDYVALQKELEGIMLSVDEGFTKWNLAIENVNANEVFGWGVMGSIKLCSIKFLYLSPLSDELFLDDEDNLFKVLKNMGWRNEMHQKFISDSSGGSTTIGLAHADSLHSRQVIFTQSDYQSHTVQFMRVIVDSDRENFMAERDGLADNPCPCRKSISIELTPLFSLKEYLR